MPPDNDEGRPGKGGPVDAPDELNYPESTTIVQALDTIANEIAEQRESLANIACSLDDFMNYGLAVSA